MGKLILVTGGARSGKSAFAEKKAAECGEKVLYVATAIPFDDEMKDRVRKHRESRPAAWKTLEAYKNLDECIPVHGNGMDAVLLDCVTVMITNIMFEKEVDWDTCPMSIINEIEAGVLEEVQKLIDVSLRVDAVVIAVTNELGLGLVPGQRLGRVFRDIAGRVNQKLAGAADEVYFAVCGIPMRVK